MKLPFQEVRKLSLNDVNRQRNVHREQNLKKGYKDMQSQTFSLKITLNHELWKITIGTCFNKVNTVDFYFV